MTDFPRDPSSGFNHITGEAVAETVLRLLSKCAGLERRIKEGHWPRLSPLLAGENGWNVVDALQVGATCAFALNLRNDDYDAALVRQGLADRGLVPGS